VVTGQTPAESPDTGKEVEKAGEAVGDEVEGAARRTDEQLCDPLGCMPVA